MTADLIQTLAFNGFIADEAFPADVNGDGQFELLFLQSPGIYQSRVFDGTRYAIPQEHREIFCLTAVTTDGTILWQFGEPYLDSPGYQSHCADQMVWCDDIDGDGQIEVLLLTPEQVLILEGATGEVRRSASLDHDNYSIVRSWSTALGRRILVKNTEATYGEHWYADPALIFDPDLNLLKTIPKTIGSRHSPRTFDLDGDGFEELLIGYEAFDASGERIWRLEGMEEKSYAPVGHHVDQMQVGPLGDDGGPRILYAGSRNIMMGGPQGELYWQYWLGHPQHVLIGDFRAGERSARLAMLNLSVGQHLAQFAEKNQVELPDGTQNGLVWLHSDGTIESVHYPEPSWPGSPGRSGGCHSGEGILIYPQGCDDGSDVVITRDWGWPDALNLSGERVFEIPFPGGPSEVASNDPVARDGYGIRIFDFDGDGVAEILIHNRAEAWIFRPPFPKPGEKNTHAKLSPVTGQGWYSL